MSKPLIVRDTREKPSHGWDFPEDDVFAGTLIKKLSLGDYSIEGLEHLLFVERKASTGELSQNIIEDRFWRLLEKSKNYKYKYLIIETDYLDFIQFPIGSGIPIRKHKFLKITSNYLISCLTRISVEYGINIIFAGSLINAEKFTHSLFKKIYKVEKNNVL